jgi:hypothetical protein
MKGVKIMKFKVGDKVRVVNLTSQSNPVKKSFIGREFTVEYLSCNDRWLYTLSDAAKNYNWCAEELELAEFTKSDLKDGMVVEYHNGSREMVFGSRSIDMNGWHNLEEYSESLTEEKYHFPIHNIDKVYKVNSNTIYNFKDVFKDEYLELIWERKPDYKEMTVEEIEKELGYKIKVIADKE